jgi:hypothetical protein
MGAEENKEASDGASHPSEAEKQRKNWWFNQPTPIDRFTGWLVAWTALLFVATIFNAVILYITDHTLKDTLVEARRSANAAVNAATAARDSADVVSASSERQLRAYIGIEPMSPIHVSKNRIRIRVVIKNFGQTPAYNLRAESRIAVLEVFASDRTPMKNTDSGREFIVSQVQSTIYPNESYADFTYWTLSQTEVQLMEGDRYGLVLCKRIRYEDVFKKSRVTAACGAIPANEIVSLFKSSREASAEGSWYRISDQAD